MSLQTRITEIIQAIAVDIKLLKQQVAGAAGAWPLLAADPPNPLPGYPWLLQTELVGAVPIGVRSAGFNHITVAPLSAVESATLSVKTSNGTIARFAATALE